MYVKQQAFIVSVCPHNDIIALNGFTESSLAVLSILVARIMSLSLAKVILLIALEGHLNS